MVLLHKILVSGEIILISNIIFISNILISKVDCTGINIGTVHVHCALPDKHILKMFFKRSKSVQIKLSVT